MRWTTVRGGRGARAWCLVASVVVVPALGGCRAPAPDPELPEPEVVSAFELGRVGGRIYNHPEATRAILDEEGLTPQEFELRVRRVTHDPVAAAEYTRGFEAVVRPPVRDEALPDTTVPPDTTTPPDTTVASDPSGAAP